MAKLKINKLKNSILSVIGKAFSNEDMKKYADSTAEIIKDRTQRGYGVKTDGGNISKLKRLAPSTIAKREKISLSSKTSPRTSNLTESGSMLDSIKGTVKGGQPVVEITGNDNVDKAKQVQKDRPFMNLSDSEIKKIVDIIEKELSMEINRGL